MKKTKAFNVITTILMVIAVLIALFLMGLRIFGLQVYNITSASMEPAYSVGTLIYVKTVEPEDVKVGDAITFILENPNNQDSGLVATHRVVGIDAENKHFYTKGDANPKNDLAPVHYNNLRGIALFGIPYLGFVSAWVQSPVGIVISIIVAAALVALIFLPSFKNMKAEKKPVVPAAPSQEALDSEAELEKIRRELEEAKAQLAAFEQETADQTDSNSAAGDGADLK